jgi:hypothetical protein
MSSISFPAPPPVKAACPGNTADAAGVETAPCWLASGKKWLVGLLLGLAASHSALAVCTLSGSGRWDITSTRSISSATAIGAVVYDETWTRNVAVTCQNSGDKLFTKPIRGGNMGGVGSNGRLSFDSDVGFGLPLVSWGSGSSTAGSYSFFEPAQGTTTITQTIRLKYNKLTDAALGAGFAVTDTSGNPYTFDRNTGYVWNQDANFANTAAIGSVVLQRGTKSYGSTCNLTVPATVTIPAAKLSEFSGVGSIPAPRANFDLSANCSGVVAGQVVGVSFSSDFAHTSNSPGVIATTQGGNNAAGIALQIFNRTSNAAVRFDTLEQGTPPAQLDGMYNFPMQVRYFQTDATIKAGKVTGKTVVSVAYK